jgi:hypothetical protein
MLETKAGWMTAQIVWQPVTTGKRSSLLEYSILSGLLSLVFISKLQLIFYNPE